MKVPNVIVVSIALGMFSLYPNTLYAKESSGEIKNLVLECENGGGVACAVLGRLYGTGEVVELDHGVARRYYTKSCDLQEGMACYLLGYMMRNGIGGSKDTEAALKNTLLACDLGFPRGCHEYANMLLEIGSSVVNTDGESIEYYKRGCSYHLQESCVEVARNLLMRDDIFRKIHEAKLYFDKACELGNERACSETVRLFWGTIFLAIAILVTGLIGVSIYCFRKRGPGWPAFSVAVMIFFSLTIVGFVSQLVYNIWFSIPAAVLLFLGAHVGKRLSETHNSKPRGISRAT